MATRLCERFNGVECEGQAMMKWYKIPGFERYEISGDLQIRNVKTGRILGGAYDWENVTLYKNKKPVRRYRTTWLRLAKAAVDNSEWVPIMGFSQYEMLESGAVRNRHTKKRLLITGNGCYMLTNNGKQYSRSKAHLVWLMFGRKASRSRLRTPVTVTKGNRLLYFDSLTEAFKFIARDCNRQYTWAASRHYTHKAKEIGGWRIKRQL